jgi:hypothetical protein
MTARPGSDVQASGIWLDETDRLRKGSLFVFDGDRFRFVHEDG